MRIALVIPQFDPYVGGAERWTWDFAARLIRHGHEVHVVAERLAADAPGRLPMIHTHQVSPSPGIGPWRRIGFAAAAETLLRRLDLDVIHDMGHGWHANVFMPHGGTRGGSFRQNLLLWPHGLRWAKRAGSAVTPRYHVFRALERRQFTADGSRLFVALSEMVRHDMTHYHALPAELVRVVYNGVDTERFSPSHRTRYRERVRGELGLCDEVVFLLVAHNFKLKGVPAAIRAVAQLVREWKKVSLVVVGNERPGSYLRLAQRLGCAAHVRFVGRATDSVPYYAAADVYVHPTYYDPCSLVVLEALASGLPVITSVHNGAGELLTPGVHGFLLDDTERLTPLVEAMRTLMDPRVRAAFGVQARDLAERHDLGRNYREMLAVYDEAIRRAPLAARRASA
jgi:UDP-glucose:(heptosyl)LPS alpha-1,3-glucosyltransferase